ncbi:HPP family protein [Flaviflagellibacter deserti]|uniref:HPP family protein n=1 Tax=Flaviflagellibacter deserti TaxID=2267266 RepID=A0ABV9Z427_9HYPH
MAQNSDMLKRLFHGSPPVSGLERFRAGIGALIGILITGLVARLAFGSFNELPYLLPPMGASAVLLFGVPASPLAQPWSIIGGNMVSALIGVTAAQWIDDPAIAAAIAIAFAIPAMLSLRCLHPPSGAVALTAVLGGPVIHAAGYHFLLWPLGANTLLIVLAALVFNNLTGRSYPHSVMPATTSPGHGTRDVPPMSRIGFTSADIEAALMEYGQLLDVDRADLEAVMRSAELRAFRRRSGELRCADIMSRDVLAVSPGETLREALHMLREHHIKVLPVTDEDARVIGILTQTDLLTKTSWGNGGPSVRFGQRLGNAARMKPAPQDVVSDVMTTPVRTATPNMPVADLLPLMADGGLHHLPVVNDQGRLVGIITQSDVIAALFEEKLEQEAKTPAA